MSNDLKIKSVFLSRERARTAARRMLRALVTCYGGTILLDLDGTCPARELTASEARELADALNEAATFTEGA